ncbi:MAG: tetratricopeptide repeat protein [Candidatus Aureabacteria bacterium]|nr:tetratricopeptide repeat protein [Candidatus Auribacterota bacterium]
MKKITRQTLMLMIISFVCHFSAAEENDASKIFSPALFQKIIHATEKAFADDLLDSLKEFEAIKDEIPNSPVGYLYLVAVLDKLQSDYMTDYREEDFPELFRNAHEVGEAYIRNHPGDPVGYLYLGGIQGYYSLHYYRVKGLFSAFTHGLRAINNLKIANRMNPELWDTYYGLGTYTYWKAEKAGFLFLFTGKRKSEKEKGIRYLVTAAEKGTYSSAEARGSLVRVLINEHLYDEALQWLNIGIEKYPTSAYQFRFRIEIYIQKKEWSTALKDSIQLEKILSSKPYTGPDAWIHLYYYMGLCHKKLNQMEEAKEAFKKCIETEEKYNEKVLLYHSLVFKARKESRKLENKEDPNADQPSS